MKFKNNNYIKKNLLLLLTLLSGIVFSQVTYSNGPTNDQINSSLIGDNVTLTNPNLISGVRTTQIATFTNGFNAGLEMTKGVFFGTGINDNLLIANNANETTGNPGGATVLLIRFGTNRCKCKQRYGFVQFFGYNRSEGKYIKY